MVNESPITPYGVLGFTRIEAEAGNAKDDDSDFSYGAGVNFAFAPNLSANLEYMRYYDDNDVTVDAWASAVRSNSNPAPNAQSPPEASSRGLFHAQPLIKDPSNNTPP